MMKSLCLDCMLAVLPDLRFRLLSGTLAALPLPASDISVCASRLTLVPPSLFLGFSHILDHRVVSPRRWYLITENEFLDWTVDQQFS